MIEIFIEAWSFSFRQLVIESIEHHSNGLTLLKNSKAIQKNSKKGIDGRNRPC